MRKKDVTLEETTHNIAANTGLDKAYACSVRAQTYSLYILRLYFRTSITPSESQKIDEMEKNKASPPFSFILTNNFYLYFSLKTPIIGKKILILKLIEYL